MSIFDFYGKKVKESVKEGFSKEYIDERLELPERKKVSIKQKFQNVRKDTGNFGRNVSGFITAPQRIQQLELNDIRKKIQRARTRESVKEGKKFERQRRANRFKHHLNRQKEQQGYDPSRIF